MPSYRGRFAPSPTGPLHFGSLVAAVASYCDARANAGEWLVRMEDVDVPRSVPGAAEAILHTLEAHGFEWDGPVMRQSERGDAYAAALERLAVREAVFPCACTRREIADSSLNPEGEAVYPGTCRSGIPPGRTARSIRVRADAAPIAFEDVVQGRLVQSLEREVGDFVVRRADGCFAYQLAVVVDDAAQAVTHVVRGADLLGSTARQIHLQRLLGFATPRYAHVPVAVNAAGQKLSKQTQAEALDDRQASHSVLAALRFLNQAPDPALAREPVELVWRWAVAHWRLDALPRVRTCAVL